MKIQRLPIIKDMFAGGIAATLLAVVVQPSEAMTVNSTSCNGHLEVTVSSSQRSNVISDSDCHVRSLSDSSGFGLSTGASQDGTVADSSVMISAGGELYEAFVAGDREAAVLLTPNRALMMSRHLSGNADGINWDLGLLVQPVDGGSDAWLTGTYTLMRANRDFRMVDTVNQTSNDGLSQIFDPVTLNLTFNGDGTCTVADYSSWFSYELTTDPAGAYSQPDGSDYALHQAVYAGEGSGQQHDDSYSINPACAYSLSSAGLVTVDYDFGGGNTETAAYYMSADLRYLVSTVDPGADLYRGFESGVRIDTARSGTQSELNNAAAGTYLFNGPMVEWQGSTGSNAENVTGSDEKSTECMSRGSLVLTGNADSGNSSYNTCLVEITSTCSVRNEDGLSSAVELELATKETTQTVGESACRFQVAADSGLVVEMNLDTAEGNQPVVFSGGLADNDEALVLRGKYEGSSMPDPSNTFPPERTISADLLLLSVVGIKYEGTLTGAGGDPDSDGLDNLAEFVYSDYRLKKTSDANNDGTDDLLLRRLDTGAYRLFNIVENTVLSNVNVNTYVNTSWPFQTWLDSDGDGDSDFLIRSPSGAWRLFIMEDGVVQSNKGADMYQNLDYDLQGVMDIDGDGDDDVILRFESDGKWRVFLFQGGNVVANQGLNVYYNPDWHFQYAEDIDGDGDDDVILRNPSTGAWRLFTVDFAGGGQGSISGNTGLNVFQNTAWEFQFAPDINGDQLADLVLRNSSSGAWKVFHNVDGVMSGNSDLSLPTSGYTFEQAGDTDNDGDTDVLMRNASDATWALHVTNDGDVESGISFGAYANSIWETQNPQ